MEGDHLAFGREQDPGEGLAVGFLGVLGLAPDTMLLLVVEG